MSNRSQIKNIITEIKDKKLSLERLSGLFSNFETVVIACGPSLKKENFSYIKKFCEDKLVICVKQSKLYMNELCDIHINNFCNYQNYNNSRDSISCLAWWDNHQKLAHPESFANADFLFKIDTTNTISYLSSVLNQDGFDNMITINNDDRNFKGPGIMYECVFPLINLLGSKKITIFGWDIGNNKNSINHFYDEDHETNSKIKYKAGSYIGETDLILQAIPKFSKFFNKRGFFFDIVSDINPLKSDQTFNKITFEKWKVIK